MHNADERTIINADLPDDKKIIITWQRNVCLEAKIRKGNMLGTYEVVDNPSGPKGKIKAPISGKIIFLEPSGHEVSSLKVCIMEKCKHDVVISSLCTFCGLSVTNTQNDSVGFAHSVYKLSYEKAKEIYEDLEVEMLKSQKLFLVLDLDNTLIHAEPFKRPGANSDKLELGFDVQQEGLTVLNFYRDQFVVKLRPFLKEFLETLSTKYHILVYTMGTRDYAESILRQVDPQGIYVSTERLISRNEMGENKFKSIKKVIYDGSLALILDDRSDVWGNIKNLVYTQPYLCLENVQGKLNITRREDVFLYMIREMLEFIHEIFFLLYQKGEKIKIYNIYYAIRRSLFVHERIAFYGLYQNEEELKNSTEYKSLKKLGATEIALEPSESTTLIFSRHSSKIKSYPMTNAPIVSLWYIYYCEMYCTHLNPDDFDLRKENALVITLERSMQKSQEEKNKAKDKIEDYLMKNESNKGGLATIRQAVIDKLETKNVNKRSGAEDLPEEFEEVSKKLKTEKDEEVYNEEKNGLIESERDHHIDDLDQEGKDNQEIIDREVNMVEQWIEAKEPNLNADGNEHQSEQT